MVVSGAAAAVPPLLAALRSEARDEARSVGGRVCRPVSAEVSARLPADLCKGRLGSERAAVRWRSVHAGEGGGSSCGTQISE